jgi:hypothetical protein
MGGCLSTPLRNIENSDLLDDRRWTKVVIRFAGDDGPLLIDDSDYPRLELFVEANFETPSADL